MSQPMQQRAIGPFTASAIGLGCMNVSHAYGAPPPREDGVRLIQQAIDWGCTLLDTAALYGFGTNEMIVAEAIRGRRDEVVLCTKGGMAGVSFPDGVTRVIDGRPEAIRRNCEESLVRLGVDVIDVYYLHRWDKQIPIEESVGAMADLVRAGKVRALGLSEVSAATLRRAHAVHPIAAVQTEYSLWTRNPEIAVLQACRELGAAFVAFSPVARGFLGGELRGVDHLAADDIRRFMPRFSPEGFAANQHLQAPYEALAQEVGCTPAQLALAWLLHRDPIIIPLPGTQQLRHLAQNLAAADVVLSASHMARLDALINAQTVQGERYNAQNSREVDTENF